MDTNLLKLRENKVQEMKNEKKIKIYFTHKIRIYNLSVTQANGCSSDLVSIQTFLDMYQYFRYQVVFK